MRGWRFYDHFRTDSEAPARRRQIGTRTPVLAIDGADLAAAIATIQEVGAEDELAAAVADAFPGGSIGVKETAAISKSRCASTVCCDPSTPPSFRTARCVICCWSPLCCRRDRRR